MARRVPLQGMVSGVLKKLKSWCRRCVGTGGAGSAAVSAFEHGQILCKGCGRKINFSNSQPMEFVACPKCAAMSMVPLRVGGFWLYEPLGGGGMGSVYKAWYSEDTDVVCAIKILARADKELSVRVQMLLKEFMLAKAVGDHPCLPRVLAGGYADGEYYLAMELIEGERLDKRVSALGKLSEAEVIVSTLHLLSAEQHLYDKGYLFRDMKPENIFVTPDGRCVLLDFGLMLPLDVARNQRDIPLTGSVYYIPPERITDSGEGAFSEIYSIGLVMYYELMGRTFFDAEQVKDLAAKHVAKVRLATPQKMPGISEGMSRIVRKMTQQAPEGRYQTFGELGAELNALRLEQLANPPVVEDRQGTSRLNRGHNTTSLVRN